MKNLFFKPTIQQTLHSVLPLMTGGQAGDNLAGVDGYKYSKYGKYTRYEMFNGREITSCPKCGGKRVQTKIKNNDGGKPMLKAANETWFFGRSSEIAGLSCTVCGYTEFYATEPDELDPNPSQQ